MASAPARLTTVLTTDLSLQAPLTDSYSKRTYQQKGIMKHKDFHNEETDPSH